MAFGGNRKWFESNPRRFRGSRGDRRWVAATKRCVEANGWSLMLTGTLGILRPNLYLWGVTPVRDTMTDQHQTRDGGTWNEWEAPGSRVQGPQKYALYPLNDWLHQDVPEGHPQFLCFLFVLEHTRPEPPAKGHRPGQILSFTPPTAVGRPPLPPFFWAPSLRTPILFSFFGPVTARPGLRARRPAAVLRQGCHGSHCFWFGPRAVQNSPGLQWPMRTRRTGHARACARVDTCALWTVARRSLQAVAHGYRTGLRQDRQWAPEAEGKADHN
uniref:Uncharacterized protein n=1 Tax=Eutreptiella gymnastica TaxID=73025 RepID=A0A7S4GAV8_9EUGL